MDDNNFRETTTRRGHIYGYYYQQPSAESKLTILFLHGFPSTHRDWSPQITHFARKGYGIIAPDLLGYGRTSAPEDVSEYRTLAMVEDIVDILSDLKVTKIIAVGHDWGSILLSRFLNTHIDYVVGAAFLAGGYLPPQPTFDYKVQRAFIKQALGYDVLGYWKFFSADDAAALTEKNIDSFYAMLFPADPLIWKTELLPLGKAREWIEQNKQCPRAPFWTAEQQEAHKAALLQKGLLGPYNWYKAHVKGLNNADEQSIPQEAYNISIPTFFGGAMKDQACPILTIKTMMPSSCSNITMRDFDTSHWVMHEAPDEVNEALEGFFATLS